MRVYDYIHALRDMESALPFCNGGDLIALSHVHVRARNAPMAVRACAVLREALTGGDVTEYLWTISPQFNKYKSRAHAREISIERVMARVIAHAIMQDAPILVEWISRAWMVAHVYEWMGFQHIVKSGYIAAATRDNIDIFADYGSVYERLDLFLRLVFAGRAQPAHYAWFHVFIGRRPLYSSFDMSRIPTEIFAHARACANCGEWIEYALAGDYTRACAIYPLGHATTRAIFTAQQNDAVIGARIGPLFAQYLMTYGEPGSLWHRSVLAQCSRDSREFLRLVGIMYDLSCKAVSRDDVRRIEHMLCASAKNPDDMVFARMLGIARESGCVLGDTCEVHWSHIEGVECLARTVRRLEYAGFRVELRDMRRIDGLIREMVELREADAIACAEVVLPRMPYNSRVWGRKKGAAQFTQLFDVFGKDVIARVCDGYFIV